MFQEVVVVADLLLALLQVVGLCECGESVADLRVMGKVLLDGLFNAQLGIARQRDDPEEGARPRPRLILEKGLILGLDHLLEEPLRLVSVQDREGPRQPDGLAVHPERPVSYRVEGSTPEALGLHAGQLMHPVEHLLRRLVGEGEKQDLPWAHALRKEPRHPVSEGPSLPGACTGKNQQRAGIGRDRQVLVLIELGLEIDRGNRIGRRQAIEGKFHECGRLDSGVLGRQLRRSGFGA